MRLTTVLCRQHIGRMFKKHWIVQGNRVPLETGAEAELKSRNIPVLEPQHVVKEEPIPITVNVIGMRPQKEQPKEKNRMCYVYGDNNVLVNGIEQAQILSKTITIDDVKLNTPTTPVPSRIKHLVEQAIYSSHLYDAQQQKLPVFKDPERPAWNFPREYGILYSRRMRLLSSKLIKICENTGQAMLNNKFVFRNVDFTTTFEKDSYLVQLQLTADSLIITNSPLKPITDVDTSDKLLPNIYPLKPIISIPSTRFYDSTNNYPFQNMSSSLAVPHTVFIHHDSTKIANLYETEVTESQITGRALLKSFAVAASYARNYCMNEDLSLKTPVTVQCINTNGQFFQFGVFQLNTLNLNGTDGIKNIWFSTKPINLFETCQYKNGRPVLEGVNWNVFNNICTFYCNK